MARVVVIANQKGGVGKTTTAVNLSASLGAAERKVLLIDIDAQANATSGVGIDHDSISENQIYQVLLEEKEPAECIHKTTVPFLDIIPATADLIGFEVEAIEFDAREHRLKKALTSIRGHYDVILIDCPPSLNLLTLNALTAADGVLIPLQSEYYALEGLSRLLKTIELIRVDLNPALSIDGIVLTMFDRRNNLSHQVAQEVMTHFKEVMWKTRIPRNIRLSEAPSFGKPILLYDIRSKGAQSYLRLAEEFLKRIPIGHVADRSAEQAEGGTNERTQESTRAGTLVPYPDETGNGDPTRADR